MGCPLCQVAMLNELTLTTRPATMCSRRSRSCETVEEAASGRTQPAHFIGGHLLRWRCRSLCNGRTLHTPRARWVVHVASIKRSDIIWRRSSNGPRPIVTMCMTHRSGPPTPAVASECTHPRRRWNTQPCWRLPSQCQPAGGRSERAWPLCKCRGCRCSSQWGAASIDSTWTLGS